MLRGGTITKKAKSSSSIVGSQQTVPQTVTPRNNILLKEVEEHDKGLKSSKPSLLGKSSKEGRKELGANLLSLSLAKLWKRYAYITLIKKN